MCIIRNYSAPVTFSLIIIILSSFNNIKAQSKYGQHDTILTSAVVYEGDTIPAQVLAYFRKPRQTIYK